MITVEYICKECGIALEVEVPARAEEADVSQWVDEVVMKCAGADHAQFSPNCAATVLSIKIWVPDGTRFVGEQLG